MNRDSGPSHATTATRRDKPLRVACGQGFYGDWVKPIRTTIERGDVSYVCSDHLSELTLAILQKDRLRDPSLGYARDVVTMTQALWPLASERGIRFISNAGGLNPLAAAEALAAVFKAKSWKARIGVVEGDALIGRIDTLIEAGEPLAHMDTGADIASVRERLLFANAYLGARPIVQALAQGADIVVTGRVADAALFLAPLVHEFGWRWDQWGLLAQGLLVGHLLECSASACGGNFGGDWESVPDLAHIGYPIAEVSPDGDAFITKAPGTGGLIDFDTIRQQMLYEVHNPTAYLSPDVTLDMSTVRITNVEGGVSVVGATGRPPPPTLKIVAGYEDGWMGQAVLGYSWPDALKKARAAAEVMQTVIAESGAVYEEMHISYQGYDSLLGPLADPTHAAELNEVFLRMAVRATDRRQAEGFGRHFPWIGLGGPPFVTISGMLPARQLLGIWPTTVRREQVESAVTVRLIEV
jgi:hypothetical protein